MAFYLIMLAVLVFAVLAAIILVILLSVRNGKNSAQKNPIKPGDHKKEEQAAVTAATWTSLNPPSS